MNEPYTGGCACGAIRYEVSAEPAMMNDCQCRQCQRDSGTGHGAHLTFVGAPVDGKRRGQHLGNSGRRRNPQEPRLLPNVWKSGLYNLARHAGGVRCQRGEP